MTAWNDVSARLEELLPGQFKLWASLVNRDCGVGNKAGVDACGAEAAGFLEKLGFRVRFMRYEKAGNLLVAERGDTSRPFVLLAGHLDTVYPDGEAAKRPFAVRDGRVTGPGALDMKGGIAVMFGALRALVSCGWDRHPVKVILAGDEENGHSLSGAAEAIRREAKGALYALNFETGYPDGSAVLSRKGSAFFRIDVKGVGAHAGNNPQDGRSAVVEVAAKTLAASHLQNLAAGLSVNVGVIGGGTAPNAVAEHAHCLIDVRFVNEEQYRSVRAALERIAETRTVPGTTAVLTELCRMPAMEKTSASEKLLADVNRTAARLGIPALGARAVGGGSDASIISQAGVPVLCAMGVRGEFNHTEREYALADSLAERTKLAAGILFDL
ncbi:MAG: Peptidase dimerization domain protein [Burkholderia sp.]|jgi:glutamate carboxypeptidase